MSPLGIRLYGIALRHLTYEEVTPPISPTEAGEGDTDVALDAEVSLLSDTRAQLTYSIVVTPDPTRRPIKVTARVSGIFEAAEGTPVRDLLAFASDAGGRILFPYAREAVSAVTGRGIYGPVFLDPVALQPMISADEVAQFAAEYESNKARAARG